MNTLARIAEGIAILLAHGATDISAEHDVIYAHEVTKEINESNRLRLMDLGWYISSDDDPSTWERYV